MSDSDDDEFERELFAIGPGRKSGTESKAKDKAVKSQETVAMEIPVPDETTQKGKGLSRFNKDAKKAAINQARRERISMEIKMLRDSASTDELFWIAGYRGEKKIFIPGRLLSEGAKSNLSLFTQDMLIGKGFNLQNGIAGIFCMRDSGESDVHWLQVDGKEVRKRPFIPGDALFQELSNQPKLWRHSKGKNKKSFFK